ncbi:MAG: hydroxyacylglutathione hydrolase [Pseudomonadota bacterium]
MLEIQVFPCLQDNYGFLLHCSSTGQTASFDSPEADAINAELEARGWELTHIFNTHHHFDHAGGNEVLKAKHGCTIVGGRSDAGRIPGIDVEVGEGDVYAFGATTLQVFDVPGHTSGHVAYYCAEAGAAFVGDTVFALGCGRLFEGSPAQMWDSIQKIMALPDDTQIYCAHEYTQANARFAVTVDPGNRQLALRVAEIDDMRSRGEATVPTPLGLEKMTNPFLRPFASSLRETLGMNDADDLAVFAETRRRKDNF